jgi:2-oxoisovalerate dehydrogenase E2 component (dihydrolipoyl transacylase)
MAHPGAAKTEGGVTQVTMPQLGESVTEGQISRWLKQPGDEVKKYEALVEVITDKVNAEVPHRLRASWSRSKSGRARRWPSAP